MVCKGGNEGDVYETFARREEDIKDIKDPDEREALKLLVGASVSVGVQADGSRNNLGSLLVSEIR